MLNLKPYLRIIFAYLVFAFLFCSCKKQTNPIEPEKQNPVLSFKYLKINRTYGRIYWSKPKGIAATDRLKYTVSINGKLVDSTLNDTTCLLPGVLATLSYSGRIVVNNGAGIIDSVDFKIPAERGFIYSTQDNAGIICYTIAGDFVWRQKIGYCALPAVSNDTLFVQGWDDVKQRHVVYALSTKTGKIDWSVPENIGDGDESISIIYDKGSIFTISDRDIYVRRASNGKQLWHTERYGHDSPYVNDDLLLCTGYEGRGDFLKAYDTKTGLQKWMYQSAYSRLGFPTEKDHVTYFVDSYPTGNFSSNNVFALNAFDSNTGIKKWSTSYVDGSVGTSEYNSRPFLIGNTVFVSIITDTGGKFVYAIDKDSGQFKWMTSVSEGVLAGGAMGLYVFAYQNVAKLDIQTGQQLWSKAANSLSILTPGKIYSHSDKYWNFGVLSPFKLFNAETGDEDLTSLPKLEIVAGFTIIIDGITYYLPQSGMYRGN